MSGNRTFSAFISYTAEDLAAHADVVSSVLRKLRVTPIDHRDSDATGAPSVAWCMEQIEQADILIVLVAERYGWVPPTAQGGDGIKSITWMEVEHAQKKNKIVLAYILTEDAAWPMNLVESKKNPGILPLLNKFKDELKKNVSGFFTDAKSLDGPISRNVPKALEKLAPAPPIPQVVTKKDQVASTGPIVRFFYNREDPPSVMDRMSPELPKRILSLEGGSIDCFIIIGYLEKIEKLLQKRYKEDDFKIADYYDLIIGTGFNSVLALELAKGKFVRDIEPLFKEIIQRYFSKTTSILTRLYYKYDPQPLRNTLKKYYGTQTLGSKDLKTGFAVVVTRFDQSKPWHFLNHEGWSDFDALKNVPLDQLLEGSLAMPSYMPYVILNTPNLGDIVIGDGGFTIGNDSSLYALLLVSNHQFPYKWRFGENMLSLTTIGSKGRRVLTAAAEFKDINLLKQMPLLIDTLLAGAAANSESLLNALAGNDATRIADTPIGLTSHRFDILLSPESLGNLGFTIDNKSFDELFDGPTDKNIDYFLKIGRMAADKQISQTHFSRSFDVRDIGNNIP